MKRYSARLIALLVSFCSSCSFGGALNPVEILMRCYSQLTQQSIPFNHPLIQKVQSGALKPSDACFEILKAAKFDPKTSQVADTSNAESKSILKTMHKLHTSFVSNLDISVLEYPLQIGTRDIFDSETAAYYYTRALFMPQTRFDSIVLSAKHLRAIRTNQFPTKGPDTKHTIDETIFSKFKDKNKNKIIFAPQGELFGVEEVMPYQLDYSEAAVQMGNTAAEGQVPMADHYGGGILGSAPYLLSTMTDRAAITADGGLKMARGFGKAVFKDFLCRELPVISKADLEKVHSDFTQTSSAIPFRQTEGCVQCHASMDRVAATVRNISYISIRRIASDSTRRSGGTFLKVESPSGTDTKDWPASSDANFYKRQPDGALFFTDSAGVTHDIKARGLTGLGTALAQQDDLYLCAAKRYYAYFMGVNIPIDSPDNLSGKLSAVDNIHYGNIKNLAKDLKQNQNLLSMIQKIFLLKEYALSDFGNH
jgi:hypothetical protein